MSRFARRASIALLVAATAGCVIHHHAAPPAPPPAAPAPQQPPPPPPPPPPPAAPAPPPPPHEGWATVRAVFPLALEGRARAKDKGHGGTLDFESDLGIDPRAGLDLAFDGFEHDAAPAAGRLQWLSLDGKKTLAEERSYGGVRYPAGSLIEADLDWLWLDLRYFPHGHVHGEEFELRLGYGLGVWWVDLEVGEDSMDAVGAPMGVAAQLLLRPAPALELGVEAATAAGAAFPFPGYAAAWSVEARFGVVVEDVASVTVGYVLRSMSTKIKNTDSDETQGSHDRDTVHLLFHGPMLQLNVRF